MGKPAISANTKVLMGGLLAFVAGYTDSISIMLHKAYASMMTGNLIAFSVWALKDDAWTFTDEHLMPTPLFILVLILTNMLGVFVYHMAEHCHRFGTSIISPVGAIIIAIMATAAYMQYPVNRRLELFPLTFIFGIQNAMSLGGAVGVPTTLCTGHLGTLAGALQKITSGKCGEAMNAKTGMSLSIVLFFLAGALAGVFSVNSSKDTAFDYFLLVPAVILLAILMVMDDCLSTPDEESKPSPSPVPGGVEMGFLPVAGS